MEQDSSVFACLPREVRNSILMQAFQQLDQRHRFAVIPLVSSLWRILALAISRDIDVTIMTEAAADQLKVWVSKHGHGLRSFSVTVQIANPAAAATFMSGIMSSFSGPPQLLSLSSIGRQGQEYRSLNACAMDLAPFTGLTALKVNHWHLTDPALSSVSSLTLLRSLDVSHTCLGSSIGSSQFIQSIASDLVQLTALAFNHTMTRSTDVHFDIKAPGLAPLCDSPQLKVLHCESSSFSADILATLGNLPLTALMVRVSSDAGKLHLADWVRRSGQRLEKVVVCGVGLQDPRLMLDPFRCLPQLQKLGLFQVSVSLSEVSLLTQLTSIELTACSIEDAGLR